MTDCITFNILNKCRILLDLRHTPPQHIRRLLLCAVTAKAMHTDLIKHCLIAACRDSLVTWQNTLIDGHNRFEICSELGIEYSIVEHEFKSLDDAKLWIISNQFGRRNLSDGCRFELAQAKKEILLEIGRLNMAKGGEVSKPSESKEGLSIVDKPSSESHNTQKTIAKDLGWSTGKVAMADKVWSSATPEVLDKVKSGDISINSAVTEKVTNVTFS